MAFDIGAAVAAMSEGAKATVVLQDGPQGATGPQGPQGIQGYPGPRGSKWFISSTATPDPVDVPNPQEGDQFLYPSSRDIHSYLSGTWTLVGTLGA